MDLIFENKIKIRQYLNELTDKFLNEVLFSTHDEMMCQAVFLSANKDQFENFSHAFITFWARDYLLLQDNTASLEELENQLIYEKNRSDGGAFSVKNITQQDWDNETQTITRGIVKVLRQVLEGKYIRAGNQIFYSHDKFDLTKTDTYWGIYIDRNITKNLDNYYLSVKGELINAVSLHFKWNQILFVLETSEQYAYFSWGTGA